jgi:hypothetical protein
VETEVVEAETEVEGVAMEGMGEKKGEEELEDEGSTEGVVDKGEIKPERAEIEAEAVEAESEEERVAAELSGRVAGEGAEANVNAGGG